MDTKYSCKSCGCQEFISQPNRYDVFKSENGKVVFQYSEIIDDESILYCRDCSEILELDTNDVVM